MTWLFYIPLVAMIFGMPFLSYAYNAGYDAVKEGRAKLCFGQVTTFTMYEEVKRLAARGDRFAFWTLQVMRAQFLAVIVFVMVGAVSLIVSEGQQAKMEGRPTVIPYMSTD